MQPVPIANLQHAADSSTSTGGSAVPAGCASRRASPSPGRTSPKSGSAPQHSRPLPCPWAAQELRPVGKWRGRIVPSRAASTRTSVSGRGMSTPRSQCSTMWRKGISRRSRTAAAHATTTHHGVVHGIKLGRRERLVEVHVNLDAGEPGDVAYQPTLQRAADLSSLRSSTRVHSRMRLRSTPRWPFLALHRLRQTIARSAAGHRSRSAG